MGTGHWSAFRKRVCMMSGAKEDNVEAEEAALIELERELEKRRAALVTLRASQSSKKDGFLANVTQRQLLDTTALLELLKWNTPTIYNVWEGVFQSGANPRPQPRDGSHDRIRRHSQNPSRSRPWDRASTEPRGHVGLHGQLTDGPAQDHRRRGPHQARHLWQHVGRGECDLLQGSRGSWVYH